MRKTNLIALFLAVLTCEALSFGFGFTLPPNVKDSPRRFEHVAKTMKELTEWATQNQDLLNTLGLDGTVAEIKGLINLRTGNPEEAVARLIQLDPALQLLRNLPEIEELGVLEQNVKGIMAITRSTAIFAPLEHTVDGVAIVRNEGGYRSHAVLGRRLDQYEQERLNLSPFGTSDGEGGFIDEQSERLMSSIARIGTASTVTEILASEIELTAIESEAMLMELRSELRLGDLVVQQLANEGQRQVVALGREEAKAAEVLSPVGGSASGETGDLNSISEAESFSAPSSTGEGYRDPNSGMVLSEQGVDLIIEHEVGGESYYNNRLRKPTYPGGASGVTIGIGYDLGYNSKAQIQADWGSQLSSDVVERLVSVAGLKRNAAKAKIAGMSDISIPFEAAKAVFYKRTMPRFCKLTNGAFPTSENLHEHCQAALVSLVFNRGSALKGARRSEMRQIRDHILRKVLSPIPGLYRAMKRIWVGSGLDGLLRRRDDEAALFQLGINAS